MGFPNGDYLRQLNMILHLWNQMEVFPVEFVTFDVFEHTTG